MAGTYTSGQWLIVAPWPAWWPPRARVATPLRWRKLSHLSSAAPRARGYAQWCDTATSPYADATVISG